MRFKRHERLVDRSVPREPRLVGGGKGHNIKRNYLAGKGRPVPACGRQGWGASLIDRADKLLKLRKRVQLTGR